MLKNGASKRPTSSFRKCAPFALNYDCDELISIPWSGVAYAPMLGGVGMPIVRSVHSVFGKFRPGAFAATTHLPETFDVGGISWEAAGHADDGDGHDGFC